MESSKQYFALFLRLALVLVLCLYLAPASAQPGFLTISCGSETNFTSNSLNIVTSTGYISTGYNSGPLFSGGYDTSFRFFNDSRKKHCYKLPTLPDTTYLVRTGFWYANFSELYGNITFDLTINGTHWTTINIAPVVDPYAYNVGVDTLLRKEVLVRSTGNVLYVCLVRGTGLPFITMLQLRTLDDSMYTEVKNNQILVMQARFMAGPCCIDEARYPDVDKYDRIWNIYNKDAYVDSQFQIMNYDLSDPTFYNTTVIDATTGFNRVPEGVMMTAWSYDKQTTSAWFCLVNLTEPSTRYYAALYFQEIDASAKATATTGRRKLTASLIGVANVSQDITLTSEVSALTSTFETSETSFNFSLTKDRDSSLGPLLNAFEMYSIFDMDLSTTDVSDLRVLAMLQENLALHDWTGDPCFPVPWDWVSCSGDQPSRITRVKLTNMWLSGTIPSNISILTELTEMWLDSNFLQGPMPDLTGMNKLVTIRLSNNSLTGPISESLGTLPNLTELLLHNNNFSGEIPKSLLDRQATNGLNFTYYGNVLLQLDQKCLPGIHDPSCLGNSKPPQVALSPGGFPRAKGPGNGMNGGIVAGATAGGLAVLASFLCLMCFCLRKAPDPSAKNGGSVLYVFGQDQSTPSQARAFTLQEVVSMTSNFAKKLGQGSFGPVYYGRLGDGQEVAVKVNAADSSQGTDEFINEVVLLSRVHHKYLVSLVGYCEAPQQKILVYAYMPNGTLTEHLHGEKTTVNPLSWKERLNIALNAAQGLEYLHTFCNPPIIHRDVKPSNILLDDKLMAKVADFGMSKCAPEETRTGFSTAVKGTFGYLDPEYLSGWRLTTKSDVYSFGIVLLELITGRKPTAVIHFADGTQGQFMSWTRTAQRNGDVLSIVDPDLNEKFNTDALWKVAELAWGAVETQGSNRPDMGEIVRGLMEAIQMELSDFDTGTDTLGQHEQDDREYESSRASYSSTAPLKTQASYSSIPSLDSETIRHHQPR